MSFSTRLQKVKKAGLLTTADLSLWFDRPYPTVRGWLDGYEPWGPNGDRARHLLDIIESAVEHRRGFPVPVHLSPSDRREHMRRVKNDHGARLPKTHSA